MPDGTLEQQRARFAWEKVQGIIQKSEQREAFKRLAKGAPVLIMNNGLMQTLAFYQSRSVNAEAAQELVKAILGWLEKQQMISPAGGKDIFQAGMQSLQSQPAIRYLRATEEAIAILRWIRQFADAVIPD
jgi:CRISPR-associated protein Cmr5